MSRMNKAPQPWQLFIARKLNRLPPHVVVFILDRIAAPLVVMLCALMMAVVFPLFMLAVFVIAPFSPKMARELFLHLLRSLGNE